MRISSAAERWNIKKARCQLCDVKFGHRFIQAMGLFDYKCAILPKSHMILQTGEAMVLVYDLIILHKWYFRKLYTIK